MQNNFEMPETLDADNISARRATVEMSEALFKAINASREHLREYLYWVDDTKSAEDEAKALEMFMENWENKTAFMYVLFDMDNRIVGTIDAHEISHTNNIAYFGYWLGSQETGKGYISKILPLFEKALFDNGIHRLVIECEVTNKPSEAVALRNGYSFEGIAKEKVLGYGTYRDVKVHAKIAN